LRGTPGFGKAVLKILAEKDLSEYEVEQLVEELGDVPPSEILPVADELRKVAESRFHDGHDLTDDLLEILTRAGSWSVAKDIATDATSRLSTSRWDRAAKLRSQSRQIAAELENAAAESESSVVVGLTRRWREVERDRERDHEENKKKRDPLLGLPVEDPGE